MFSRTLLRCKSSSSSSSSSSALSSARRCIHTLPPLKYDYSALTPYISAEIMELHHKKHHQTYVNNLNAALEKEAEAIKNNGKIIVLYEERQRSGGGGRGGGGGGGGGGGAGACRLITRVTLDLATKLALAPVINFNGGGHYNHSIFFDCMAPPNSVGGGDPDGELLHAIEAQFGSVDALRSSMSATAVAVQGSGWSWLAYNTQSQRLEVVARANQDALLAPFVPLLGIDVWEHAYYLQYKNVRPDYIGAFWHVVNWKQVAERYRDAQPQAL